MPTNVRRMIVSLIVLGIVPLAQAGPDVELEVAVFANGAKLIGDKTGSAEVTVRDRETGELLAKGRTQGGTGSTERIMHGGDGRYADRSSDDDAVFRTRLALEQPREVRVDVRGPLDAAQPATASATLWLIPGDDRSGERRFALQLNGYLVDLEQADIDSEGKGSAVVSLQMLCGCPVKPGGTWDADAIDMKAMLVNNKGASEPVSLHYTGEGVRYEAAFNQRFPGAQFLRVILAGKQDSNTTVRDFSLSK